MTEKNKKRKRVKNAARTVALVGIMAASVECGKLVLASLPNIEIVTLLLAVYGYVFGGMGVAAAVVFVCIEPLIWGFNTWVISYFLYWPLVSLTFMLLKKARVKNRWILTAAAVLLTIWFGVLSSLVDVGLFSGYWDNLFYRFGIYYMRGIWFYVSQVCCNAVLFPTLFRLISGRLERMRL